MTEAHIEVKRGFWAEVFTGPRIVTFAVSSAVFLAGGGMWLESQRSNLEQLRERVQVLEARVDRETKINGEIYMRRDNLSYELTAIREELARQRAQIEGLRKDLR